MNRRKAVLVGLFSSVFGWQELKAAFNRKPMSSIRFQGDIKPDDIMMEIHCTGYLTRRLTVAEVMEALDAVKDQG